MLLGTCDDRRVLEEIYNRGGGANWNRYSCDGWMTDAPLSEWNGVTADADGNATALELDAVEITQAGIVALAEALTGLQITERGQRRGCEVNDEGTAALAEALPGSQVTTLNLGYNEITDEGAAAIAHVLPGSQVTALYLHSNQITDAGTAALAEALAGSQVTELATCAATRSPTRARRHLPRRCRARARRSRRRST